MDFVKVFIFLILVYLNCLNTPVLSADDHDEAGDFCYLDTDCGPDSEKWGGVCHTGRSQSPINLRVIPPGSSPLPVRLEFNDGYKSEGEKCKLKKKDD
jgi:hypothetical protein